MAYYAQLVDDIVTEVIGVSDEVVDGAQFAHDLLGGIWVQTFMDNPDKTYAGIGYEYLPATQNFRPQQPYPSWTWANNTWNPRTPMPSEGKWSWNEAELAWVAI